MQLTTLGDVLHFAEQSFIDSELYFGHGTDNAWDEAVAIALFVLQLPPDVDASIQDRVLTATEITEFTNLINLRIKSRMPLPYLSHEAWFANIKFYVDERVIIPRSPMAELLLNGFQPWRGDQPILRILDLCTGSACIAIACATVFKDAIVDAVDISEEALAVALKNVEIHQLSKRINLIHADLFSGCEGKRYDIIISNPPYVDATEMKEMPEEYHWEPRLALAAGSDGLSVVKQILRDAPRYLQNKGLLFVEVGNAADELQKQFPQIPFTWLEFEQGGEGVFLLTEEDKACWADF